jgi:Right handed beta helix region
MMRKGSYSVGVITLLFAGIFNATAATFYVSSKGNDSNNGKTIKTAWNTIDYLNSKDFAAGDTILFEGGAMFTGNIHVNEKDGNNPDKPIVFSSYGKGRAIIHTFKRNQCGFFGYNAQGVVVKNLIFESLGNDSTYVKNDGIAFYNDLDGGIRLKNIVIKNCEVRNFGHNGIAIGGYPTTICNTGFDKVVIDSVSVHDVRENGILTYGKEKQDQIGWANHNIRITNSVIHDVTGYSGHGHKGSGIIIAQVDSCLIDHCVAYNNGTLNTACGGPGGIWAWSTNNITIQYCESHHNSSGKEKGCDGLGFDFDGGVTNSTLQYCYSHDNAGAGILLGQYDVARPWAHNTVRYNISENDARTNNSPLTIFKGSGCSFNGLQIYNNTIFVSPSAANHTRTLSAFQVTEWVTGVHGINIFNNIFETTGGIPLMNVPKGYYGRFNGNLYWTNGSPEAIFYQGVNYTTVESWRQATGNEIINGKNTAVVADPLLINKGAGKIVYPLNAEKLDGYKFATSSPAKDAGVDLKAEFGVLVGQKDFYGNPSLTDGKFDIGAYEFAPVVSEAKTAPEPKQKKK